MSLTEFFSHDNMERLLGPYWFIQAKVIPVNYWWLIGMTTVLTVLGLSMWSREQPESQEEDDEHEDKDSELEEEPEDVADVTEDEPHLLHERASSAEKLRNRIAQNLTPQEIRDEKMLQAQQLAKIYDLLRQNKDQVGDMTMDDVKRQLGLYATDL